MLNIAESCRFYQLNKKWQDRVRAVNEIAIQWWVHDEFQSLDSTSTIIESQGCHI